jgi:hypothetical protein
MAPFVLRGIGMRLTITLSLLLSLAASSAVAAPQLRARNGQSVRLTLAGQHERGIGLRPVAGSWKLLLAGSDGADAAEVVDVTAGAPATKWMVAVENGAIVFDGRRFVADHAYRVQLRRGLQPLSEAIIYLYPAHVGAKQKVGFSDDEARTNAGNSDDDGIAVTPKSSL